MNTIALAEETAPTLWHSSILSVFRRSRPQSSALITSIPGEPEDLASLFPLLRTGIHELMLFDVHDVATMEHFDGGAVRGEFQ